MFFQPGQVNSNMNGSLYQQMLAQLQGSGMMPGGGMPSQQNMAPVIAMQAAQPKSNVAPQPQSPQQQKPGNPGGALGGAVDAGKNIQSLYGMGQNASNWMGNQYNSMFGAPADPVAQNGASGMMSLPGGGAANGMSGAGMPMGGAAGPGSGVGTQMPASTGMFGNLAANGMSLGQGVGAGAGGYGAMGTAAGGAAGSGAAGSGAAAGASDSAPSWLSWLWDL